MSVRYGTEENSGSAFLSRSLCYAMLAGLAIALLVQAYATVGADALPAQISQMSAQGFHLPQVLASAKMSAGKLREQLHNTWLFLYAFLVVLVIMLAWSFVERRRLQLGMGRRELSWLSWMSLSVVSVAMLYGVGTNGVMARSYPVIVPVSDVLALGFVLALPIFTWSRMQQQREILDPEVEDGFDSAPRPLASILGLSYSLSSLDGESAARSRASFQEPMMEQVEEPYASVSLMIMESEVEMEAKTSFAGKLLEMPAPAVTAMEIAVVEEPVMMEAVVEEMPLPVVAEMIPASVEPVTAAPVAANLPVAPMTEDFRANLQVMNASWGRIERAGHEIDQWFDQQRQQVMARLEVHPAMRSLEAAPVVTENFLNEKLAAVDADWAAIRRSALDMARWFGDVPPAAK